MPFSLLGGGGGLCLQSALSIGLIPGYGNAGPCRIAHCDRQNMSTVHGDMCYGNVLTDYLYVSIAMSICVLPIAIDYVTRAWYPYPGMSPSTEQTAGTVPFALSAGLCGGGGGVCVEVSTIKGFRGVRLTVPIRTNQSCKV